MTHPLPATDGIPVHWRRMVYRLAQHIDRPGIYPLTVVLAEDGTLTLVVVPGQQEYIGHRKRAGQGE